MGDQYQHLTYYLHCIRICVENRVFVYNFSRLSVKMSFVLKLLRKTLKNSSLIQGHPDQELEDCQRAWNMHSAICNQNRSLLPGIQRGLV